MITLASDVTIRLDENAEEYVKIREVKDGSDIVIVEVNGQKAVIKYLHLIEALNKLHNIQETNEQL